MITLFSGNPGSGKSLHLNAEIYRRLKNGRKVIANFPIKDYVFNKKNIFTGKVTKNKKMGRFDYVPNYSLTVDYLVDYANKYNKRNRENECLLCIDEAQNIFNCRDFDNKSRRDWCDFFSQHRKLGYNVIMVSLFDRMLDKQIRILAEYEIKHRKVNNFSIGMFLPVKTFIAITYWYGAKTKTATEFFTYNRKFGDMYDTFKLFDSKLKTESGLIVP